MTFADGHGVLQCSCLIGFVRRIVNILLCPYIIDAFRMYESGFATRDVYEH